MDGKDGSGAARLTLSPYGRGAGSRQMNLSSLSGYGGSAGGDNETSSFRRDNKGGSGKAGGDNEASSQQGSDEKQKNGLPERWSEREESSDDEEEKSTTNCTREEKIGSAPASRGRLIKGGGSGGQYSTTQKLENEWFIKGLREEDEDTSNKAGSNLGDIGAAAGVQQYWSQYGANYMGDGYDDPTTNWDEIQKLAEQQQNEYHHYVEGMRKEMENKTLEQGKKIMEDDRYKKKTNMFRRTHGKGALSTKLDVCGGNMDNRDKLILVQLIELPEEEIKNLILEATGEEGRYENETGLAEYYTSRWENLCLFIQKKNKEDEETRKKNKSRKEEREKEYIASQKGATQRGGGWGQAQGPSSLALTLTDNDKKEELWRKKATNNLEAEFKTGGLAGAFFELVKLLEGTLTEDTEQRRTYMNDIFTTRVNGLIPAKSWLGVVLEGAVLKFMLNSEDVLKIILKTLLKEVLGEGNTIIRAVIWKEINDTWSRTTSPRALAIACRYIKKECQLMELMGTPCTRRQGLTRLAETVSQELQELITKKYVYDTHHNPTNPMLIEKNETGGVKITTADEMSKLVYKWEKDLTALATTRGISVVDVKKDEIDGGGEKNPKGGGEMKKKYQEPAKNDYNKEKQEELAVRIQRIEGADTKAKEKGWMNLRAKKGIGIDLTDEKYNKYYMENPKYDPNKEINWENPKKRNWGTGFISDPESGNTYCSYCGFGNHQDASCLQMIRSKWNEKAFNTTFIKKK